MPDTLAPPSAQAGIPCQSEGGLLSRLMFDREDYALLKIVNDVLSRKKFPGLRRLLATYLHPHGIKEMAAPRELRIAYAIVHLLGSLEAGMAGDRIKALRSLRDEVFLSAESELEKNTARLLLQIIKELVRLGDDPVRQLELAHDFRAASSGKPRVVRRGLADYHLLEMPEEWNQLAFDDHVHDANTKGRKSPTHLIMDAWIKGIRKLTVIHNNFVRPEVASELLQAARIMGISVRIGLEYRTRHNGGYLKMIWIPRGFTEIGEFLEFLTKPEVAAFLRLGREAAQFQKRYVMEVLAAFDATHRLAIAAETGVDVPPLHPESFTAFVGAGQASLMHLGRFIHNAVQASLRDRAQSLLAGGAHPDGPELSAVFSHMDRLSPEHVIEAYLSPDQNPGLRNPDIPCDDADCPAILRLSPCELIERVHEFHTLNRFVLTLDGHGPEDLLMLLSECRGAVTHVEIFNLHDFEVDPARYDAEIIELISVVNSGNPVKIKKFVRRVMRRIEQRGDPRTDEKIRRLAGVLDNMAGLMGYYKTSPLRACLGTDSTGQSCRHHGMGLVVKDTLPGRAVRHLEHPRGHQRRALPVGVEVEPSVRYHTALDASPMARRAARLALFSPLFRHAGLRSRLTWSRRRYFQATPETANIYTLGGIQPPSGEVFKEKLLSGPRSPGFSWRYARSSVKNFLKILAGFVPAAVSFAMTKDWWVLCWFGPLIWFGITGLRNVIQSVMGSGGLRRSPVLSWSEYVSFSRLADSLMYTGFSVPLLDYVVKTLVMDQGLGITAQTDPVALYTAMAAVNGAYIATHNALRGLPRRAVTGNLFRSALSIPLAIGLNSLITVLLCAAGVPDAGAIMQQWAAIISKLCSDGVAGLIEGLADRSKYIAMRLRDYKTKSKKLYDTYSMLELRFPQKDVETLLESPQELSESLSSDKADLEKILYVNALDLLYFWMYQPRARTVLRLIIPGMSQDERRAFLLSQYVLRREYEISRLFLDGLVGKNFARALSFYLSHYQGYLDELQRLAGKCPMSQPQEWDAPPPSEDARDDPRGEARDQAS
ncbi:hypothetical protein [Desulfolutivibrio sulfoxidireducens]|uniref:hypothetical protein n=1 Tax=Desulfolutivibrio sulfoxidireducens TaxID=2773299 RepID=UPI00159E3049|nr:hypothetical protein [Desulfolutivibrio sulfoxidireducens]QLA19037.1 hypothetical protein GD604_04455 [Desulfolutivibrio sulfoxidireducens]